MENKFLKVPKEQKQWFTDWFIVYKREWPDNFMDRADFLKTIFGIDKSFRNIDWLGDSFAFHEDVCDSILISKNNKKRWQNLFDRFEYIQLNIQSEEFYELENNLAIIHNSFKKAVTMANESFVNLLVHHALVDAGVMDNCV